jgi:hypothetical protein
VEIVCACTRRMWQWAWYHAQLVVQVCVSGSRTMCTAWAAMVHFKYMPTCTATVARISFAALCALSSGHCTALRAHSSEDFCGFKVCIFAQSKINGHTCTNACTGETDAMDASDVATYTERFQLWASQMRTCVYACAEDANTNAPTQQGAGEIPIITVRFGNVRVTVRHIFPHVHTIPLAQVAITSTAAKLVHIDNMRAVQLEMHNVSSLS